MLKNALFLAISALIVKVLGAAYRIPLTAMLGAEQMGVYTTAFHVYMLVSSLSLAGIPIAAAQLCAARLAVGDEQGAKNIFVISRRLLLVLGTLCFLSMAFCSDRIALWMHCPQAAPAIHAVSPAVLLGSLMAAHRARFQGKQQMGPIAISQLAEQLVRLGAGLVFAYVFLPMGAGMGAAGAMLGTALSEAAGYILLCLLQEDRTGGRYDAEAAGVLLRLALPLTFGACIMPFASVLENLMLVDRLALFGRTQQQALSDYGVWTGMVASITTLPVMLTGTLSVCLMPNIAASVSRPEICRYRARQGMTAALLFGIAMSCGLYVTAEPVLRTLYGQTDEEIFTLAVKLLKLGAVAAFPHCICVASGGALQGLGKTKQTAFCQILCAAVKLAAAFVLLPKIGIAAYGSASVFGGVCACLTSFLMLRRACKGRLFSWMAVFLCIFSAILMIFCILLLQRIMGYGTLSLCLSVIVGGAVYLCACSPVFKEEKLWERSPSLHLVRANREN